MYDNPYDVNEDHVATASEPVTSIHGKKALYLFLWFAFLAVAVVPANALHLGFKGVVMAMALASAAIGLMLVVGKAIRRKMREYRLSKRQWLQLLMGVAPAITAVEAEATLLPSTASGSSARQLTTTNSATTTALLPVTMQQRHEFDADDGDEDEDLPDSIIEDDGLFLSERLYPSIHHFLGQIILLSGIRRMGKSNLLAVLLEEMAPFLLPMLIIDTDDEYAPLANHTFLPRGMLGGSAEAQTLFHLPRRQYLVITPANAYHIGRQILDQSLQVVLNMKSYASDDQAGLVLCELIRGMNDWQASRPNSKRIPVLLAMDEASKWLPENPKRSSVEPSTQQLLYNTFFGTVVNRGGKQGFGAIFATQRIQDLNKSALQAPWKFLFYQAQRVDLEQYATFGLEEEDVLSLRPGECYVFGPHILGFRCFMRKRTSPHLGHTPGLDQLHDHQRDSMRPLHALHFTTDGFDEQVAIHPNDGRVPQRYQDQNQRVQEPEGSTGTALAEPDSVPPGQNQQQDGLVAGPKTTGCEVNGKVLTEIQFAAYTYHQAGKDTIVSLAAALSSDGRFGRIDTNRANTLRNQLEALGFITLRRRSAVSGE